VGATGPAGSNASVAWNSSTVYSLGDVVLSNGTLYRSLQDANLDHAPGASGSESYWRGVVLSGVPQIISYHTFGTSQTCWTPSSTSAYGGGCADGTVPVTYVFVVPIACTPSLKVLSFSTQATSVELHTVTPIAKAFDWTLNALPFGGTTCSLAASNGISPTSCSVTASSQLAVGTAFTLVSPATTDGVAWVTFSCF
jgi:hypothetical protein